MANTAPNTIYVSAGGKHYMTDPFSKQWIEVPPQFNTIAVFSPESGASAVVKIADRREAMATLPPPN